MDSESGEWQQAVGVDKMGRAKAHWLSTARLDGGPSTGRSLLDCSDKACTAIDRWSNKLARGAMQAADIFIQRKPIERRGGNVAHARDEAPRRS